MLMKLKSLLFLALAIVVAGSAQAQSKRVLNVFEAKSFTVAGKKLPYRVARLDGADARPALVVFLHGGSGCGDNNKSQLHSPALESLYNYLNDNGLSAYILAPQCASGASWSGYNPPPQGRRTPPGPGAFNQLPKRCEAYNPLVKALIDSYIADCHIDTARVYLCGISMGAAGVWALAADYPHTFAAVLAASGDYEGNSTLNLLGTPIIYTRGTAERRYAEHVATVDRLRLLGIDITFFALDGLDHRQACDQAFTPDRLARLFELSSM